MNMGVFDVWENYTIFAYTILGPERIWELSSCNENLWNQGSQKQNKQHITPLAKQVLQQNSLLVCWYIRCMFCFLLMHGLNLWIA